MESWGAQLALFAVGLLAGTLNVVAGGGSFLTLPVLILLGLPPTVANGTNRVGILVQNVGAVWGFRRHGFVETGSLLWAAAPSSVGALIGTWLALEVGEAAFRRILALLMIAITLLTLWNPLERQSGEARRDPHLVPLAGGFFLVGIYGGFVQAGVGFLILAVTTLAGLDLVRGNAVKVLAILVFTVLSLGIFAWQGKVEWAPGLVLAAGNLIGGLIGVRLTVLKGHGWVRGVVTLAVVLLALRLWFAP